MNCVSCGKKIRDRSEFCVFCGASQKVSAKDLEDLLRMIRSAFTLSVLSVIGSLMPISVFGIPLLVAELMLCGLTLAFCFYIRKRIIQFFPGKKAEYRGKGQLKAACIITLLTFAATLFTLIGKTMG